MIGVTKNIGTGIKNYRFIFFDNTSNAILYDIALDVILNFKILREYIGLKPVIILRFSFL